MRPLLAAALALAALSAGCSPGPEATAPPSAEAIARAASLTPGRPASGRPLRPRLPRLPRSARTGAPLAGDRAAWDPRWAKGLPALTASVIGGFKGMRRAASASPAPPMTIAA